MADRKAGDPLWKQRLDGAQRYYYHNTVTNETQSHKPLTLDWTVHTDEQTNQKYYCNSVTKETTVHTPQMATPRPQCTALLCLQQHRLLCI